MLVTAGPRRHLETWDDTIVALQESAVAAAVFRS